MESSAGLPNFKSFSRNFKSFEAMKDAQIWYLFEQHISMILAPNDSECEVTHADQISYYFEKVEFGLTKFGRSLTGFKVPKTFKSENKL